MSEPLPLDRFRALADAYGGTIARWPTETRAAATAMAAHPLARAILADAETLDATLDRWTVPAPSMTLHERVLPAYHIDIGPLRRVRLWWSGIGLAAALAGVAAGSVAAAAVSPVDPPTENATAFGDLGGQEG